MSFKFRKKVNIGPGIAVNINKSTLGIGKGDGASITIGEPGLGVNVNKKGMEGFAGINGTGVGYRTLRSGSSSKSKSTVDDALNDTELQKIEFDEKFNTLRSTTLQFVESFLTTFCLVLLISLLVSIFVEYSFNEILVATIWFIIPLIWGIYRAANLNKGAYQCECGSFEFSIKQVEFIKKDYLHLNKNGTPDMRKKYNPIVTTSLIGIECKQCNKVTNNEEVLHL